ncbi:MAG TPA: FUSC family protein, partial [Actinospica sp.]|nr:FUSC family protein [Actinospica sp.]
WSAAALRRRLIDAQLAIDELAHAAAALAEQGGDLVRPAARIAGHLARREYPAVLYAAKPVLHAGEAVADSADSAVRRAFELLEAVVLTLPAATEATAPAAGGARHAVRAASGGAHARAATGSMVGSTADSAAAVRLARAAVDYVVLASGSADPPQDAPDEPSAAFIPAATFTLGMLPGSASVAGGVQARGGRWNPLSRASLTTRQAVQVALAGALAIILGRQISEARYYWAVIATFVTFSGTATRSETSLKAVNRVAGTLVGLGAGIGLAELTAGHTLLTLTVIVLAMACGFYVVNLSYAGMIVFVTIMVSQLYSALHEFTPGLLVLRLEETSLGAAIGIAVGLVVLPTSTRETVRAAERAYLDAMAAVLDETATAWEGTDPASPTALVRTMEDRLRRLTLVARPLTRPLISGADPALMRRRLALQAAAARHVRALAAATPRSEAGDEFALACRALARIITGLPPGGAAAAAPHPLPAGA